MTKWNLSTKTGKHWFRDECNICMVLDEAGAASVAVGFKRDHTTGAPSKVGDPSPMPLRLEFDAFYNSLCASVFEIMALNKRAGTVSNRGKRCTTGFQVMAQYLDLLFFSA